jgi:hypothetical protein
LKEEKAAKEARILAVKNGAVIDLKRPASAESSAAGAKRARIRSPSPQKIKEELVSETTSPSSGPGSGDCKGPEFNVMALKQELVQELLMASLAAVDPVKLAAACEVSSDKMYTQLEVLDSREWLHSSSCDGFHRRRRIPF